MSTILVAEDDRAIREGLTDALELAGYEVYAAADGGDALGLYNTHTFDLLLLDVMMPRIDGFELCRRIRRENPAIPMIFLTARAEEIDKVVGLELGADDYVTKPFGVRELLARIAARLRRTAVPAVPEAANTSDFEFAGWRIRPEELRARRDGKTVELTRRELELVRFFADHPRIVLDRDRILRNVWHLSGVASRTLDQHLVTLRKKLETDSPRGVYGAGYRYDPPDAP